MNNRCFLSCHSRRPVATWPAADDGFAIHCQFRLFGPGAMVGMKLPRLTTVGLGMASLRCGAPEPGSPRRMSLLRALGWRRRDTTVPRRSSWETVSVAVRAPEARYNGSPGRQAWEAVRLECGAQEAATQNGLETQRNEGSGGWFSILAITRFWQFSVPPWRKFVFDLRQSALIRGKVS